MLEPRLRPNRNVVLDPSALYKHSNTLELFTVFKKAFDSIHRGKMRKILTVYGILKNIVECIGSLYEGTRARVLTPDVDTLAGVLQGTRIPLPPTFL